MNQPNVLVLTEHDQLKSLSDPLRVKILSLLIEKPLSGQQISQMIELSRSKVHYHLGDLEKNGLIKLVAENKKRNMTQKLYQAVAKSFIPSNSLLPFSEAYSESRRQLTLSTLDRARSRVLAAPEHAFLMDAEDPTKWSRISTQTEVKTTKEKFKTWVAKYHQLLQELEQIKDEQSDEAAWYYIATVGFELDEAVFEEEKENE
ncbi:ArsR/SmtB family transcription factor [Radiobacillus sp. PE A8.2]|uniref:ArsR/SmtB family transcription factor n=1 Tax=Radiobacillus sp. PE A8.2 TaxID=3380349 RepID=UPI00388E7BA7